MNKVGMNMFVWTMSMDEELTGTFAFLKRSGFDFVEIPINTPGNIEKWMRIGQQLSEVGLAVQACTLCGPEHNLISPDASVRQAGITHLKQVIDCCALVGAQILMGPFYAGFNVFTGKPATTDEWNWSVTSMREVAEYAQSQNVILAAEYLNRFETYLLTCADDLVRYIEAVDHPNCRAAFDTFHANIEEKNMGDALRTCAPYLVHVQISENDRSTPGKGHVNFDDVFSVLKEINYEGPIAIEAFGPNPPELAAATHIFRPMFESPEQLAVDGLAFIKNESDRRNGMKERTSELLAS
ncbi:sugar phosphate isomerase/epimerase [Spirosoma horti]